MKTTLSKAGILGILSVVGALTAVSAFAIDRENVGRENLAMARQELMNANIQISGTLICANENNGQPCELNLTEAESGRSYSLDDAGTVRALYDGGTRNVSIHGRRIGSNKIRVINATAM